MNGFLEGTDFLDAIIRKLKGEEGKEEHSRIHNSRKKEKKGQCMIMYKHVTYKKKICIMGKSPIQTTELTVFNQAHSPRMHETLL